MAFVSKFMEEKKVSKDMLNITGLRKQFGEKMVLNGLNLNVPEQSIFGFIGKNGAGKTTTMKMILGLMNPDSGEIIVNDEKVLYGQTPTNRFIGYLPDVPEFYGFMTPAEYLHFCGEISGMNKSDNEKRCKELLELVGLSGDKHRIKGFSRGMKQRLGIAQALYNHPKLLICDEPTSALDPVGRKEILDIMLSIREQTTILFSTHILSDVERICTDVAFLDKGVINIQGKLSDIKAKYRKEEYKIELENESDVNILCQTFKDIRHVGNNQLILRENENRIFDVMRFLSDRDILVLKIEREEPTLESLFMEVAAK